MTEFWGVTEGVALKPIIQNSKIFTTQARQMKFQDR